MNRLLIAIATITLLASCSTTKNIPDDDQLFVGLTKIAYPDDDNTQHASDMKAEVEAALATAPNGSLFGSSYYRSPFSFRLSVYNKYANKDSGFARWMTRTFGRAPVLMSQVNPTLRASVAQSILRNNGYFRGNVTFETVPRKNPKKAKIAYTVRLDSLFTLDTITYAGFPTKPKQLMDSTAEQTYLHLGAPFTVSSLESERSRISNLFRNNGYYYFNSGYTSYLADTLAHPGHVSLQLKLADELPPLALSRWYIGNTSVSLRRSFSEPMTDSIQRRHLTILFNGKNPPIRPRVVLKNMRLRPRQLFSYQGYQETLSRINASGIFSSVDMQFTPREGTDTLDMRLNCTFDKPYDFYFEANATGRTIGRYGPELKIGFTRRNAFRGAEKIDINLHGSYEWQRNGGSNSATYQYGADAAIEFPRIILPWSFTEKPPRRRPANQQGTFFSPLRTTLAKVSSDVVRRPDYYKMHIVTGEWTYRWQSSPQSLHELSPITLKYQYMNTRTELFDSILSENPYLDTTLDDYFIPKIRYTYTYTSPQKLRNPIRWETTIEESGNVAALIDVARGKSWNTKGKEYFKNPYSQFLRLETDFTKTWTLSPSAKLVGHVNAGILYSYGNSDDAPFSEMFYAGGANSIRAFPVRGVGPGAFSLAGLDISRQFAYALQNGDMKFVANLEYRPRLFGNLEGAIFLDIGNVWLRDANISSVSEMVEEGLTNKQAEAMSVFMHALMDPMLFSGSEFLNQLAIGTGVGLRYDLGFLVIRLDWGFALHRTDLEDSGYFNIGRFRDANTLHFAVGYPF